jgi:hypothetical protein
MSGGIHPDNGFGCELFHCAANYYSAASVQYGSPNGYENEGALLPDRFQFPFCDVV